LGWLVVYALPDTYEARARVYVDTTSRLRGVLESIAFEPDVDSRVQVVRQAMLGRPQLEEVARKSNIDLSAATPEQREELFASLLERIQIRTGFARTDQNLYSINFRDSNRATAIAVVDALLNTFVEDVLQQKQEGSEAAEEFLREQIRHYADLLSEAEQRLAEFKKTNFGMMPDDSGDYIATLQMETRSLEELQENLVVAQSRKRELETQVGAGFGDTVPTQHSAGSIAVQASLQARISEAESQLAELLLRNTERHPDVIALTQQLQQLRARQAEQITGIRPGEGADLATLAANPVYQTAQIALNDVNVQIAGLQGQIAERQRRIEALQNRLTTAPEIEAELSRLNRDYGSTKVIYDQLTAQLERERLVNQGDDQNVINFQIIDPPQAAFDPVAPPRAILLVAVLILGLGAGAALAFVLDQLNPVFMDTSRLRLATGKPVLGAINLVRSAAQKRRDKRRDFVFAGVVALLVVCAGLAVVLKETGSEYVQSVAKSLTQS
jgi:polysaccharide chain length determinant protein (PEP-CTERM system associated)